MCKLFLETKLFIGKTNLVSIYTILNLTNTTNNEAGKRQLKNVIRATNVNNVINTQLWSEYSHHLTSEDKKSITYL